MANNTIVLKYTDQYNTDDETTTLSSVGYGGNTTMVVWDKIEYDNNGYVIQPGDDVNKDIDHVTISQQEMTEVDLPHGTDLFGYYYKDRYGHYHYIYEENKYFQGLEYPNHLSTLVLMYLHTISRLKAVSMVMVTCHSLKDSVQVRLRDTASTVVEPSRVLA